MSVGDKLDNGATVISATPYKDAPKSFINHFYNHFHMAVRLLHFICNMLDRYGFSRTKNYVFNFSLIFSDIYFNMVTHKPSAINPQIPRQVNK